MKASENMMLEALSRLAGLHRPLEDLLRDAPAAVSSPAAGVRVSAPATPTGDRPDAPAAAPAPAPAPAAGGRDATAGPAAGAAGPEPAPGGPGGAGPGGAGALPAPSAQAFSFGSQLAGSAGLLEAAAQQARMTRSPERLRPALPDGPEALLSGWRALSLRRCAQAVDEASSSALPQGAPGAAAAPPPPTPPAAGAARSPRAAPVPAPGPPAAAARNRGTPAGPAGEAVQPPAGSAAGAGGGAGAAPPPPHDLTNSETRLCRIIRDDARHVSVIGRPGRAGRWRRIRSRRRPWRGS